jgi:hypothetical protein
MKYYMYRYDIQYNSQILGMGAVIARNCFVNVHCITLIISAPPKQCHIYLLNGHQNFDSQ